MSWEPWEAALADDELEVAVVPLPAVLGGGVYLPQDGWAAILLDESLDDRERRAVLAHELIHHERGGGISFEGQPPGWLAVVRREEDQVDAEVAARLVPVERLRALCEREGEITVYDVAEEFEVPVWVAARALGGVVGLTTELPCGS